MFFEEYKTLHCIGIGGIGLSGLARIADSRGLNVSGSDSTNSFIIDQLKAEGISVSVGHSVDAISDEIDLIVYSEAVPTDNVERAKARKLNIKEMSYFQALGELSQSMKVIAVAGTHGKTTTTAMLGLIFRKSVEKRKKLGLNTSAQEIVDPLVLVGTNLKEFYGKNVYFGVDDAIVLEACEYRNNFRFLKPRLLAVVNMDLDHLDFFSNEAEYQKSFHDLAENSEEVIWPGEFDKYEGELGVPGEHNKIDAGLAAECARRLGVPEEDIQDGLREFKGTWRRYELKGEFNNARIYDDYAHHPIEITAVLKTARTQYPDSKIRVIYQPHQYSRTKAFFDEFARSFSDADEVIIPNIYECRDSEEDKTVSAEGLAEAIHVNGTKASFGNGLENTLQRLKEEIQPGEIVFIMGAGDVTWIAEELVKS